MGLRQDGFDENSLTPVAPSGGTPAFGTGELEEGVRPSKWGKFVEMAHQVSFDSPVGFMPGYEGAWIRGATQFLLNRDAEKRSQTKLSPEEANKLYPGLPKPFDEPVHREVAQLIYDDNERRKKMQTWVDRGPEGEFRGVGSAVGGIIGGIMGLPGGFVGVAAGATAGAGVGYVGGMGSLSALDPVNLALNASGAKVVKAMGFKPSTIVTVGENLAINTATEVPTYFQKKAERQDVSLVDTAKNIAGATLLAAGIAKAFHIAGDFLSKESRTVKEQNIRAAIREHENGAAIDMTPATATRALRTAGAVQPGQSTPYTWQELQHPSERMWYAGRSAESNELIPLEREGVEGLHLSDDGMVPNNLASSPESPLTGRVAQYEIPANAKFLNLDEPVSSQESKPFVAAVEKKFGLEESLPKDATVARLLDEIEGRVAEGTLPETALTEVVGAAKELGYDGYRFVREVDGSARHNGLVLFDEGRAQLREEFTANKEVTPTMRDGEALAASERLNESTASRNYSPEVDNELQELKTAKVELSAESNELDPVIKDQVTQAESSLKELAAEDPALKEELDGLKAERAVQKQESEVLRNFAECYLKGMI